MRYKHVAMGLLVFFFFEMIYINYNVLPYSSNSQEKQLQWAMGELQKLRMQNKELYDHLTSLKEIKLGSGENEYKKNATTQLQKSSSKHWNSPAPSLVKETVRRKVDQVSLEFWLYLRSQLNKLKSQATKTGVVETISSILSDSADYQRMLRNDFHQLANKVGNLAEWRLHESRKLGDLVQKRLEDLQNPKDCKNASKMVCDLDVLCGYGCHLHHVTYCLMMAYATERTLILKSKGWQYASDGWETVFLPLSDTCREAESSFDVKKWGPESSIANANVVKMPLIGDLHPRPNFLPLAIPEDLTDRLLLFHGDPPVWWIGQFVKYLTRPQKHLEEFLNGSKQKLRFKSPIVGVHVRRTDKVGTEAAYHSVEEYMQYVDDWFDVYENEHPGTQRRVFLASDEPSVLKEAQDKYTNYVFITDNDVSKSAGLDTRYTNTSLKGIILDIHLLSLCDYLVCTFSSNVCRVAYELMQPMRGDTSQWFKSLDDIYYFSGQNDHSVEAVKTHKVIADLNQIELQTGDLIIIAGNHWDGFSQGRNVRTGNTGLFPSYKVVNSIVGVKMPKYPGVMGFV